MTVELNTRCKICNLIKVDQNLWVEVHNKVIEEGLTHSVVLRWLNSRVDVLNASKPGTLTKFNNANFTSHFKMHISDLDTMKSELKKYASSRPKETISFDSTQKALADSISQVSRRNSYNKISDMIDMMEENLDVYSTGIREKREKELDKGRTPQANTVEIENYSKFVSDLISAKQNLLKLKNTEQTTMMAVEAAVECIIEGMAVRVVNVADEVKNILEAEMSEQTSVPKQVSQTIKARFSGEMRTLVKEAMDMVKKNYGVK